MNRRPLTILFAAVGLLLCGTAMGADYYNDAASDYRIGQAGNNCYFDDGNSYTRAIRELGYDTSGSAIFVSGGTSLSGDRFRMGYTGSNPTNNHVTVSGAGSTLTLTSDYDASYVGSGYGNQSITVENGGSMTMEGNLIIGRRSDVTNCLLTVDNATFSLSPTTGNRELLLTDGPATDCHIVVTSNGRLYADNASYTTAVGVGSSGNSTNTLDLTAGGAMVLANSSSTMSVAAGNYIRLDQGFLAWNGNMVSSLSDSAFQVWDGGEWAAGVRDTNYTATYFVDEAEAAAAGFAGFGEYTVFTNIVPEPTTLSMLSVGGLLALRRRRRS